MELLTVDGIALMLGVSTKSVYRWVKLRKIPFIKLERHLRFQPESVLEHFREKTEWSTPTCFQSNKLLESYQGRNAIGSLKSEKRAAGSYSEKG